MEQDSRGLLVVLHHGDALLVEKVLYQLSPATNEDLKRSKPGRGLHLASSGTGCLEVGADLWSSTDKDPKSAMVELLAARSFGERETPALPGLLNY